MLNGSQELGAGHCQPNHFCFRSLRLQKDQREVRRAEWKTHADNDLAATGLNEAARLILQRMSEGIVAGKEEPRIASLLCDLTRRSLGEGVGIVTPLCCRFLAGFAGEFGGRRS